MAKQQYKVKASGTELHMTHDDQVRLKADMESELAGVQEIQADSDAARTLIALSCNIFGGPFTALQDFDDALAEVTDRLQDELEYFDYGTKVINTTVADGQWQTPASVNSFSSENVGAEAVLSINDTNSDWWQTTDVAASITYRAKLFPKRYSKIRLRSTAGDLRAQLQGVNVRIAKLLANIDEPGNLVGTFDFTHAGDDWIEAVFASPKLGQWLKLDGFTSLHATPSQIRIREVDLFATITNHEK